MLVCIESPYARDEYRNGLYLAHALRDSAGKGEFPFASHEMYTRVFDDLCENERRWGIRAGLAFAEKCDARVMYLDLGLSAGMIQGLQHAVRIKQPIYIRGLSAWRGPKRLDALRALNGWLDGSEQSVSVDWSGF